MKMCSGKLATVSQKQGESRRGKARQGKAWCGEAWRGEIKEAARSHPTVYH